MSNTTKTNPSNITNHYNEKYFSDYQRTIGEFGGRANLFKFKKWVNPIHTVIDFGCGGGFLLSKLDCAFKIGIEINPIAREFCLTNNNVRCFQNLGEVQDGIADLIISNHCLEHTISPMENVDNMYSKLKKGGRIILVVPLDSCKYKWSPNDINNHLYSFSPMNLGNILQGAGFSSITVDVLYHKWPPFYMYIEKIFGAGIFNIFCLLYGRIDKKWVQVRATGIK